MIAKFHSAPGHSMETTLTINIPPPGHVRSRSGRLKAKEVEEVRVAKEKAEKEEQEREKYEREKYEREQELLMKEQLEREHHERERRHGDRNVSYKDKFHKMREKYDRVTLTHETHERELEMLNAKIKKMQAENDLLLDAIYLADASLYYRYFPESDSPPFGSAPLPPSTGRSDVHYHGQAPMSHLTAPPPMMVPSSSSASSSDPYVHSGLNPAYMPQQPHVEPSPGHRTQHQQMSQPPTPYATYGHYPPAVYSHSPSPFYTQVPGYYPPGMSASTSASGERDRDRDRDRDRGRGRDRERGERIDRHSRERERDRAPATASNHPPMPPPLPPLQSSMAAPPMSPHAAGGLTPTHTANNGSMLPPPPTSAASTSSNGTIVPRSSRSRRRSDVSSNNGHGGYIVTSPRHTRRGSGTTAGVPLAPEEMDLSLGGPVVLDVVSPGMPSRTRRSSRTSARDRDEELRGMDVDPEEGFETTRTSRNGSRTPTTRGASMNGVDVSASMRTPTPFATTPNGNGRGVPVQEETRAHEELQVEVRSSQNRELHTPAPAPVVSPPSEVEDGADGGGEGGRQAEDIVMRAEVNGLVPGSASDSPRAAGEEQGERMDVDSDAGSAPAS
ncbi:unnamed protein product [Cyclocybe aegerita]|uniref:Uncharacterized protein n=1 Tax=Cyclocybe aegerita TaxID=1973307 RepID=A0A8S0X2M2_CYCAE|nr:unnamed protein product [Cyclocybe aegerita]